MQQQLIDAHERSIQSGRIHVRIRFMQESFLLNIRRMNNKFPMQNWGNKFIVSGHIQSIDHRNKIQRVK